MSRPPQGSPDVMREIDALVPSVAFVRQATRDEIPTAWVPRDRERDVLAQIKRTLGYRMLYDLTAIDERIRTDRGDRPSHDFTVMYHLLSYDRNADVRVKVALDEHDATLPTITDLWPAANWYEREVFDLFGVRFLNHPDLRRILMPDDWEGHPLRKDYPIMGPRA